MASIFTKSSRKNRNSFAGAALHGDSLRYLELSGALGSLSVVRQEMIPLGRGIIVKDSLADTGRLLPALEELKSALGGFHCPVALGIPARDVILRLLDYPRMDIGDVKEALQLEFDRFFPYPYAEAAADISEVEVPNREAADKIFVLAATCRRRAVDDLMRMTARAGMTLSAVEPVNVAFFRAAAGPRGKPGGYFVVFVEPETTHIILGYRDNGILFRSASVDLTTQELRESDDGLMPILRDVQNTVVFAGNQYKELALDSLVLGGLLGRDSRLPLLLESGAALTVSVLDVRELWGIYSPAGGIGGFEAAFGLAVRNLT
ncbi:MAG: pilus assembly protein PilM [Synergistaceae bacterium]|jgi:type IV pilus assembly protein PilM|nr:pilus assembly protein PilM [Synergistaceae bacterium]